MIKEMKCSPDAGIFAIRLGLAAIFLAHGIQKFVDWDAMSAFFGSIGLPEAFFGLIAVLEVLSGLAMLLGIGTRLAGWIIAAIMIGAVVTLHWEQGFFGGWEFNLILLVAGIGISCIGPGAYRLPVRTPSWLV